MKLAILFSGQGSHHPGMFRLCETSSALNRYLEEVGQFLELSRTDIDHLICREAIPNEYAQPLLCAWQYAVWNELREQLPQPVLFSGLSLGEVAAYGCANSFSFKDLLVVSQKRAELMNAASSDNIKVIAVRNVPVKDIEPLCHKCHIYIMIISGEEHLTVGGNTSDVTDFVSEVETSFSFADIRNVPVSIPSHTPLLTAVSEQFNAFLKTIDIKRPEIPVLAGVSGHPVRSTSIAVQTLSAQISQTVHWYSCMKSAMERGADVFLEIGPGNTLSHMIKNLNSTCHTNSIDSFRTLNGIADWINKFNEI